MKAIVGKISLLTFLTVALFSCKRESAEHVNQDSIYRKYVVKYSDKTGELYSQATFRFVKSTGTRLKLEGNSYIKFNGVPLDYSNTYAYYRNTTYGFPQNSSFEWQDADGTIRSTPVELNKTELPIQLNYLSRAYNYDVVFVGSPLQADETVSITITDVEGQSKTFRQSTTGATHVRLDYFDLNDLQVGVASVTIKREREFKLYDTSSGGRVIVEYESKPTYIDITY